MTAPNNMVALLGGDDYVETIPSTSVVNGRLRYIVLDVDKPGKYFFNLQSIYNATVGEQNKILPIQFRRSGEPIPLNNTQISMDGTYPDGTGFHVVGEELDSNSAVTQFVLLNGLFQTVGEYVFTFTIENTTTGAKETSRPCFFSVSQNINSLAIDWNNGVNPYDSEYSKWKAQVEAQINGLEDQSNQVQSSLNNLNTQITNFKDMVNGYTANVSEAVNNAVSSSLTNIQNSLTWTKGSTVTLQGTDGSSGNRVEYYTCRNGLYITGWIAKPKTVYNTFRAFLPTSVTQRAVTTDGGQAYYVGVNDSDFSGSITATNPTEFHLDTTTGVLYINGSANDGGARIDWFIPLKDA